MSSTRRKKISLKLGIITLVVLMSILQSISLCQENNKLSDTAKSKSTKELINELKTEKDKNKKREIANFLRKRLPQTEEEKQLLLNLLDDRDVENIIVSMYLLGGNKEKRAVPKII